MSIPLSAGATLHPLAVRTRADAVDAGEVRELARVHDSHRRPMPAIDEALGFTAGAYEGAGKKELT